MAKQSGQNKFRVSNLDTVSCLVSHSIEKKIRTLQWIAWWTLRQPHQNKPLNPHWPGMVAADGSQLSPSWTALCQWSLLCPRLRPPFLGPYRSSRAWPPCLNLSSSAGPPKFQRSLESPLRPLLGLHHNQTSPVAQSCFFALSLVLVPRVLPDKSPAGQPPSQGVALGSSPGHSTLQPRLHTTTFTLL